MQCPKILFFSKGDFNPFNKQRKQTLGDRFMQMHRGADMKSNMKIIEMMQQSGFADCEEKNAGKMFFFFNLSEFIGQKPK